MYLQAACAVHDVSQTLRALASATESRHQGVTASSLLPRLAAVTTGTALFSAHTLHCCLLSVYMRRKSCVSRPPSHRSRSYRLFLSDQPLWYSQSHDWKCSFLHQHQRFIGTANSRGHDCPQNGPQHEKRGDEFAARCMGDDQAPDKSLTPCQETATHPRANPTRCERHECNSIVPQDPKPSTSEDK